MADSPMPPTQSKAIVFARRSASTLLLWGVVTSIFMSRYSWAFLGLTGTLAIIATIEYFRMLKGAGVSCFPRFGILLALSYTGVLYSQFLQGANEVSFAVDAAAIFIAIAGAFTLALRRPIQGLESLVAVAITACGLLYIPFLFNFAARVTFMVSDPAATPGMVGTHGAFLLLWLLAVTKFTDMGAYIVGSMAGRHKMIPHVSPSKTWEGFGGALIFSQIAACGLYAGFPEQLFFFQKWSHVIFLGVLLAVLAVIGDLAESVVKRSLNAKDSGKMLPGIGGSLDLIDSICFTAPALYFYLKWVLLPTA
ncbi:MAG: phosphatidate cytidylyltransferase [Akkermansiaceae bacterium]